MEEAREYSLDEKKREVQKILDSHLWDQSFSVENFDEDMLSLLISLLTEKDDEKKKELREQVNDKIKTSERGLFSVYLWIHEVWDSMDTVRYSKSELRETFPVKRLATRLTSQCSGIIPIQDMPQSFIFTSGFKPRVTTLAISESFSSFSSCSSLSFSVTYASILEVLLSR